jgi:hypothetical protein
MSTHEDRRLEELEAAEEQARKNSRTIREVDVALCKREDCQEEMHSTEECEHAKCMFHDSERESPKCEGPIEIHKNNARCRFHSNKYWDDINQINRDYPDTNIPPDWFDPTLAGERWDDDY